MKVFNAASAGRRPSLGECEIPNSPLMERAGIKGYRKLLLDLMHQQRQGKKKSLIEFKTCLQKSISSLHQKGYM
jgi:hypothetical protein